jgi:hypothetical protein
MNTTQEVLPPTVGITKVTVSGPAPRPWFAPEFPWPWKRERAQKGQIGAGNPQHVLTQESAYLGFSLSANVTAGAGSNGQGSVGGNFPANVGSVLNMSAAAIASAPAFYRQNNDQG